ncbi:MAG: hypothetical protein ABI720_11995 [Actinomycetes bacterium]
MASGRKRDERVAVEVVEQFAGDGVADADGEILGEPMMGTLGWLRSTPSGE